MPSLRAVVVPRAAEPLGTVVAPKQARSERTLERLLAAAEALVIERGITALSIPEVARRARSSVGGFYGRFRDKDELIRALEERFLRQLEAERAEFVAADRWVGASLADIAHHAIERVVAVYSARHRLIAAFIVRAAQDAVVWQDGEQFRARVAEQIAALVLTRRREIRHPDPELAVDLAIQLVFGLMFHKVVFGEVRAGGRALADSELVRELERGFLAQLGVRPR